MDWTRKADDVLSGRMDMLTLRRGIARALEDAWEDGRAYAATGADAVVWTEDPGEEVEEDFDQGPGDDPSGASPPILGARTRVRHVPRG